LPLKSRELLVKLILQQKRPLSIIKRVRWIPYSHQTKPPWRSRRTSSSSVSGIQYLLHFYGRQAPTAHLYQSTYYVSDHSIKKTIRPYIDNDEPPFDEKNYFFDLSHRGINRAALREERGEIMPPEEIPGTFSHVLYLKRKRDMPAEIAVEGTGERMIVDDVPV